MASPPKAERFPKGMTVQPMAAVGRTMLALGSAKETTAIRCPIAHSNTVTG